jgi:hypothetical protein
MTTRGANDGTREVGQDIFEWMYVLRRNGRFTDVYGDGYVGGGRGVDSLATQREQEFRNASAGAGATEKVSEWVGGMLEACRLRADSWINLEDVEESELDELLNSTTIRTESAEDNTLPTL